ncbi:MAG TPA: hypothetical protein VNC78_01335 [Actinomycetota bacterium]|nr:hypothetical protein [Actinomycetota bacterium]
MSVLAYLLSPVSGLVVFLVARSPRARFHGLQSVIVGTLWPLALYLGAYISPRVTQIVAAVVVATWVALVSGAATGRDPHVPWLGRNLARIAGYEREWNSKSAR